MYKSMARNMAPGEQHDAALYHPLALDVWTRVYDPDTGEIPSNYSSADTYRADLVSSYDLARMTAERESAKINDPRLRRLGETALFSLTSNQANRNGRYFNQDSKHDLQQALGEDYMRYVYGDASPSELTSLVGNHGALVTSLEVARTTHVGDWSGRRASISDPVKANLFEAADPSSDRYIPGMDTQGTGGIEARYKAKMLHEDGYMIERKRPIAQSFGANVLTVMRINFLVNPNDPSIPAELRKHLEDERKKFTDRSKDAEYDFEEEHEMLKEAIEPSVRSRNIDDKPSYLIPLQTAMYSYSIRDHLQEQKDAQEMQIEKDREIRERQEANAPELQKEAVRQAEYKQHLSRQWRVRYNELLQSSEVE